MSKPGLELSISTSLDHFDLVVEAQFCQPVTGIFGASGAGKTTILKCIAGLKKDVEGSICFNGQTWLNSGDKRFLEPEQRRIGYVPQNGLLFPNKSVRENLLLGKHRRRNSHESISWESVCELLELDPLLDRLIHRLSGGERQRVSLGRAIYSDPQLLLLDEPLAALDMKLKRQILPYLQRIREELQLPVLMISHYPAEIQALCDEVLVIDRGQKVAMGATQEILFSQAVLELTHGKGYENLLSTIVAEPAPTESGNSRLTIEHADPSQFLITTHASAKIGSKLWVGIPSNDIIIATQEPRGISAQNILKAQIKDIQCVGDIHMVCTELADGIFLNAEISDQSLRNLGLSLGSMVFLIIKSGSCILYRQ